MIPYGRQSVDQADIDAVVEVLKSDWLTQGPTLERFEVVMAERCEAGFAVAVCNATAALHIACLAAGLGQGDWLWTSPNTFLASANCGRYCGADVNFVDIDPLTWNLDTDALARKLEVAESTGTLPKVLVAVAFSGQSCDMRAISELARRYGFVVIEDASHAVGARLCRATGRLRRIRGHDGVQFSSGQNRDHRRRRHGADQQPQTGRTSAPPAQPRHDP